MKYLHKFTSIVLAFSLIFSSWGVLGVFAEDGSDSSNISADITAELDADASADQAVIDNTVDAEGATADQTIVNEGSGDQNIVDSNEPPAAGDAADADSAKADDSEDAEDIDSMTGSEEGSFTSGLPEDTFNGLDPGTEEQLLEKYMTSHAVDRGSSRMEKSSRAWNLTGNNLYYFNWVKSLAQQVAAGKRSYTYDTAAGSKILSKNTFTAAELGLKVVAKKSGKKLVMTDEAKEKIKQLLAPEDWSAVMTAALLDMPYELYWYNRYNTSKCVYKVYWNVSFSTKSITINTDPALTYAEIWLPLIEDYGVTEGSTYKIYVADTGKTGAASSAIARAKAIVSRHAGESDYDKLKSYLKEVCALTDYDDDAADLINYTTLENYQIYNSPWQLISVFDDDPATKVVCAGYGKAYKYLCDISSFKSNWIECQTMYGTVQRVGTSGSGDAHLWCTVRMNNGKNYIVDPTWHDGGYDVFLQGGKYNSSTGACEVSTTWGSNPATYTIRYTYNDRMKRMFSGDELKIEAADYDPAKDSVSDMPISLTSARISGTTSMTYTGQALTGQHPVVQVDGKTLKEGVDYTIGGYSNNVKVGKASFVVTGIGQYIGTATGTFNVVPKGTKVKSLKKAKKAFTVKWTRQSGKMNKARITGYQIQYSTSSDFTSGNKTVTVKGYKKTSKKVSKLKAKKSYYVRIRTYLKTGGVTYYSPWSPAKTVKTK